MRCFLISSILIVGSTSAAFADRTIRDDAKAELERGEQRFRQQDYTAAIAAFDAGYALDPQPIFLYDKAQAQRLAGNCKAAIETYRQFLETEPPAKQATLARKNIDNCTALLPVPDADIEQPPTQPTSQPFERTMDAPPTRAAPPQQEERAWWHDRLGMTLLTTGVIGVGIGAGFAVVASSAGDRTAVATNVHEWSAARDQWQRDRIIAGAALGVGAALVVGGALRLSLRDRSVGVAPTSSGGAMISVAGLW